MAVQNFLSGGFYGKLGQLVGQRWKNIRTIRTYVIPRDPKSPAQMAQRNRFADNVLFSQCAMMGNWTCAFFFSENITEWNMRMKTAAALFSESNSFLAKLPLIPKNKVAPFRITAARITYAAGTQRATINLLGKLPETARHYSIYLTNDPLTTDPNEIQFVTGASTDAAPDVITTEPFTGFEVRDDTHLRIVSNDDKNSLIDMVLSPELINDQREKPVNVFNTNIVSAITEGDTTTIKFMQPKISGTNTVALGNLTATLDLRNQTVPITDAVLTDDGTKMILQFKQQNYTPYHQLALGDGASLLVETLRVETSTAIYEALNAELPLRDATATTRVFNALTQSSVTISENQLRIEVESEAAQFLELPSSETIPSERNGNPQDLSWQKLSQELIGGNAVAIYDVPLPNGVTRNQFGGVATRQSASSGFGIGSFTQTVNGVEYNVEMERATTQSGAFSWAFVPNYTSQELSGFAVALLSDLYAPPSELLPSQVGIAYDDNSGGIVGKLYTNRNNAATAAVDARIALKVAQPSSPLPCRINCFASVETYSFSSAYATYNVAQKDGIAFTNSCDRVTFDVVELAAAGVFVKMQKSGSGAHTKYSSPYRWQFAAFKGSVLSGLAIALNLDAGFKPQTLIEGDDIEWATWDYDGGFSGTFEDGNFTMQLRATFAGIPDGTPDDYVNVTHSCGEELESGSLWATLTHNGKSLELRLTTDGEGFLHYDESGIEALEQGTWQIEVN